MKMVILLNTGGVFVFGGASDQIGLLSLLDIRPCNAPFPMLKLLAYEIHKNTKTKINECLLSFEVLKCRCENGT